MSKNTMGQAKALKGNSISGNTGTFDTIIAKNVIFDEATVNSLFLGSLIDGAIIINSQIDSTIIGSDQPNAATFTTLNTINDVLFSSVNTRSVYWDSINGIFRITGDLRVTGCGLFGNIDICTNTIQAVNTNGDINILSKGNGGLFLTGPIRNVASSGNYLTNVLNGNVIFNASDYISLTSNQSYINLTSFSDQTFNTENGDISLNTETGLGIKIITTIDFFNTLVRVTTNGDSNVKIGDTISITGTNSNPNFDGTFTVTNILTPNTFNINNPFAFFTSNSTTGSFIKSPTNNINLNAGVYVKIPSDIDLTFGTTISSNNLNAISGNTTGMLISAQGDIKFQPNTTSNYIISIPQNTKFVYGTSSNVNTFFDGNSLNINNNGPVTISASNLILNGIDTFIRDPNPLIGNFTSGSGDLTDRGIQFRYSETNGNMKLGWFGYKSSTQRFTFLTNASNNNEIITGDIGSFNVGNISVTNITLNSGGTFDVGCGTIANVSLITGCSGTVNINASANVNISSSNRISLISETDILVPNNIPILFGTNGTTVSEGTSGNLLLKANKSIRLISETVIMSTGSKLSFDGTSVGNQSIYSDLLGNLIVSSNKNINLGNITGGNVVLPQNNNLTNLSTASLQFGNTSSEIIAGGTRGILLLSNSSTGNINLTSYSGINISNTTSNINLQPLNGDINLFSSSGNVKILPLSRLIFGTNGNFNSIRTNSTGNFMINGPGTSGNLNGITSGNAVEITNTLNFDINVTSSGNVNIPNNVNFKIGNSVLVNDTNSNLLLSTNNFNNVINGNINITTSNYNLINTSTNISTNSFIVSGSTGSNVVLNVDNVRIKDPILTLSNNNFGLGDKGIQYNYTSSTGNSLGWFGYKSSTGLFTFYSTAINTSEVITGTLGSMELENLTLSNSISFSSLGNLDMTCGTISNLNTITGCNGTININATSNLNANSTNIFLNTQRVLVPFNTVLAFGNTNNSISSDSNGNMTISAPSKLILNSDVQINGTIQNVFSTVTNIQDPIFSIGGVTGPVLNDNKDRGIEFKWFNTNSSFGSLGTKTGFFGYQNSTNRFIFVPDGINISEVLSGSFGNVQFGNGFFNNIDVNCGTISNVNTLSGCNGSVLNIRATSSINVSTNNFLLPFNSNLAFGNTTNSISSDISGTLNLNASNNVNINSTSGSINLVTNTSGTGSVNLSTNTSLNFGSGSSGSTLIQSSGNLSIINSSGNINLTPRSTQINGTYGSIIVPTNTNVIFSGTNSSNRITSNNDSLQLYGFNSIGFNSGQVIIDGNLFINGTLQANVVESDINQYILPLGTEQVSLITSITTSNISSSGNTKITTLLPNYLSIGDNIALKNTNSIPIIDTSLVTVNGVIDAYTFLINSLSITTPGNFGTVRSKLTTPQNKDVGIEVERWYSTVVTSGSAGYVQGFYGWKDSLQRFVFYSNATISSNVVTGSVLGDIEVNKLITNKISGFQLEGSLQGQSFIISGTNFQIQGGSIDSTQIGQNTPSSGKFTNLESTSTTTASININTINYSPSFGDIITEQLFMANVNQLTPVPVIGLLFSNSIVRSFDAMVSVYIDATTDRFSVYKLIGIQKTGVWVLNSTFIGDHTKIVFTITNSGQIQYTSSSYPGGVNIRMKFKAQTLSI